MSLVLIGTSHKRAPLEIREKVSLGSKKIPEFLKDILEVDFIKSAVILSTCNRMEVYVDSEDKILGESFIKDRICLFNHLSDGIINQYFYNYFDKQALGHLFCVVSGLDSQVIGENQIMGQVKDAYNLAKENNALNNFLEKVFKKAINVGIEVRAKTKISAGNLSIASLAIELLEEDIGQLSCKKIVFIGVGKINQILLKRLKEKEVNSIIVANRTYEHALALARDTGNQAIRFDDLWKHLEDADILISATTSPHLIIRFDDFIRYLKYRTKPIYIFDLAIPRDIEPKIKDLPGVLLYNLEDLNSLSQKNYKARLEEVFLAKRIIEKRVGEFYFQREALCLSI